MLLRGRRGYAALGRGETLTSGVQSVRIGPLDTTDSLVGSVMLHNLGPATLSGVLFQQSDDRYGHPVDWPSYDGRPQPGPSQWITVPTRSLSSVSAGVVALGTVGVQRWMRVVVLSNQPSVTVSGYWVSRS